MKNSFLSKMLLISFFVSILFFHSCTSHKSLPYFKNIDEVTRAELLSTSKPHEPRIMPNDIISITVNSTVPGAAVDFNLPLVPANLSSSTQTGVVSSSTSGSLQNYLVDKDGSINYPVLGSLKIGGMTAVEVQQYIRSLIYPKYISAEPIINVRFLNFKVSVLGEVTRPGTYTSENGQMTILDALAAAGDMTIYGKRNNLLLVRTGVDGEIVFHNINMQDRNVVYDESIFYLQQNDKLYIEPNRTRGNNSSIGALESLSLSALSIVISVIAIITR
ncbi:MAG: hypothetical protein RL662_1547 [Bacteroidota bacterium]|jgi:polysaccharide export outer membrane protein